MNDFYRRIFSILDAGEAVVLPTEDAARSMLGLYVLSSSEKASRSAVLASSILAFDRFKELFYPDRTGRRPIDEAGRLLFSAYLVERHKEKLSYLFPHSSSPVPDERMAVFVSSVLRELEDGLSYSHRMLKRDVSFIYGEYVSFLDRCGLYEPAFVKNGFSNRLDKVYNLVFSDADLHMADFLSKIEDRNNIRILSFPMPPAGPLEVYGNEKQEIRQLFLKIRSLATSGNGTGPSDIIISTPAYERILAYIEREAALFSIPIVEMRGKSPLEYPAGMFFKDLSEIHDNGYALEYLGKFFLNPGFPFADREKCRSFILSATERNISRREDPDRYTGAKGASVYRDLVHYLEGIYSADSGKRLVNQIKSLLEKLLSPEQFSFSQKDEERLNGMLADPACDSGDVGLEIRLRRNSGDVFSFIIRNLMAFSSSLDRMEKAGFGYGGPLFPLFLKVLEKTVYVPQDRGEGVRVYPFGQALGVGCAHHFIIGLNEDEARMVLKRAPFLSDYETEGERECGDFTMPLISSYLHTSGNVHLSASSELYTGISIPLLDLETASPGESLPDSYADMARINMDSLSGYELYPLQKKGYERALTTSLNPPRRSEDLAEDMKLPLPVFKRGSWTFSYSQIDNYEKCPYVYALRYIYGLGRARRYDVEDYPDAEIGRRLHRVCELYVDCPSFDAASVVPKLLEDEMDLWQQGKSVSRTGEVVDLPPDVPVLTEQMRTYVISRYKDNLVSLLSSIKRPGLAFDPEWKGSASLDGILFEGFIDLVIQDGDGRLAIVDYKSSVPSGDTLQFDIYRLLLESNFPDPVFSDPFYAVFNIGNVKRKSFLDAGERNRRITDDVNGIECGVFKAVNRYKNCMSCRYKASCRRRYFVR